MYDHCICFNTNLYLFRTAKPFVFTSSSDVEIWRKKVHENAFAFLDLCKSLRFDCNLCFVAVNLRTACVRWVYNAIYFRHIPDIWALHEWSSWLTPRMAERIMTRRFDTIFYKTCLSSLPNFAQHDRQETTNLIVRPNINL